MADKRLQMAALAATLALATPAMAQWSSFQMPGSPYTDHHGPNGWSGTTFQMPGSPYSDTTLRGPNGQTQNCTTFQMPGSPYADTTCR